MITLKNYKDHKPKKMVTVEGAGHTLCYIIGGEKIRKEINNFIKECINQNMEVE